MTAAGTTTTLPAAPAAPTGTAAEDRTAALVLMSAGMHALLLGAGFLAALLQLNPPREVQATTPIVDVVTIADVSADTLEPVETKPPAPPPSIPTPASKPQTPKPVAEQKPPPPAPAPVKAATPPPPTPPVEQPPVEPPPVQQAEVPAPPKPPKPPVKPADAKPKPPETPVKTAEAPKEPVKKPPEKAPEKTPEKAAEKPPEKAPDTTKQDFDKLLAGLEAPATPTPSKPTTAPQRPPGAVSGPVLGRSEQDAFRRQIEGCWNAPTGGAGAEDITVQIRLTVTPQRSFGGADILNGPSPGQERIFKAIADSAMRALRNSACSPYDLPADKYAQWHTLNLSFNPAQMGF